MRDAALRKFGHAYQIRAWVWEIQNLAEQMTADRTPKSRPSGNYDDGPLRLTWLILSRANFASSSFFALSAGEVVSIGPSGQALNRRRYEDSFFETSSLTTFGFAFPPVAFIT